MEKKLYVFFLLTLSLVCNAAQITTIDGDNLKKDAAKKTVDNTIPTWEFYSASENISDESLQTARNHKLGKEAGYLYDLFLEQYIQKEEVVPGDPTLRTVIRKPNIYNAVKAIEKEIDRDLKQKEITEDQAQLCFKHVLRVALAAIDTDTNSFEEAIRSNRKNQDKLILLFENVTLKSIY